MKGQVITALDAVRDRLLKTQAMARVGSLISDLVPADASHFQMHGPQHDVLSGDHQKQKTPSA